MPQRVREPGIRPGVRTLVRARAWTFAPARRANLAKNAPDAVVCGQADFAFASKVPASRQAHIRRCRENLRSAVAKSYP